jgi:hypothetical protein
VVLVVAAQRRGSHQEVTGTYSGEVVMERDYAEAAVVGMKRSDSSSMGRVLEGLGALEAVASQLAV